MSSEDEEMNEVAVAGPSHELPPPKIFKLNTDCSDEIFEYLSLKDLHSVGKTCKKMQQVAGEYFKRNYSAVETFCKANGIYTLNSSKRGMIDEYIDTTAFIEFMPCISLDDSRLTALKYFQSHIDEFKNINHIHLTGIRINQVNVEYIKELLPKIETLRIRVCPMCGFFSELMLKYCTNIKRIYAQYTNGINEGRSYDWLLQKYQQLEQLELLPDRPIWINQLSTFFKRNPKVQRFSTSTTILVENQNALLKSKAKLDVLDVKRLYIIPNDEITRLMDLLNQLHEKGFYKRLFFYTERVDLDLSIKLNAVPDLELLCIRRFDECFNLPLLTNLKELIILTGLTVTNAQILANGLVKLERLYVDKTTIEDILPFIRQSTKLNKIKMLHKDIKNKDSTDWRVLNLTALNNEREQLSGARKVTIYVRDDVFVATKWATKNGDINLSLIEMKRSDSFEWNHHY